MFLFDGKKKKDKKTYNETFFYQEARYYLFFLYL